MIFLHKKNVRLFFFWLFLQMKQKDIKTCHNSLCQAFKNLQKIRNKWMSKFEKHNIFFWKNKKNHNMMIEAESALSVSVDLEIEKTWLVNWWEFQFRLKWENCKLRFQDFLISFWWSRISVSFKIILQHMKEKHTVESKQQKVCSLKRFSLYVY